MANKPNPMDKIKGLSNLDKGQLKLGQSLGLISSDAEEPSDDTISHVPKDDHENAPGNVRINGTENAHVPAPENTPVSAPGNESGNDDGKTRQKNRKRRNNPKNEDKPGNDPDSVPGNDPASTPEHAHVPGPDNTPEPAPEDAPVSASEFRERLAAVMSAGRQPKFEETHKKRGFWVRNELLDTLDAIAGQHGEKTRLINRGLELAFKELWEEKNK